MSFFHDNLREARELAGLTRQQLAEMLDTSPQNYGRYEKGDREPKFDTLRKICKILHVSADDLLGISSKRNEDEFEQCRRFLADMDIQARETLNGNVILTSPVLPPEAVIPFADREDLLKLFRFVKKETIIGEKARRKSIMDHMLQARFTAFLSYYGNRDKYPAPQK